VRPPSFLLSPVVEWFEGLTVFGPPPGAPENDGELGLALVPGTNPSVVVTYLVMPYERLIVVKSITYL